MFFQMAQCSGTVIEASWYVTNKQIREGLEVPFYAYYTRALMALIQNLPIRVLRWKTRSPTKRRSNSLKALDKSDYNRDEKSSSPNLGRQVNRTNVPSTFSTCLQLPVILLNCREFHPSFHGGLQLKWFQPTRRGLHPTRPNHSVFTPGIHRTRPPKTKNNHIYQKSWYCGVKTFSHDLKFVCVNRIPCIV